MIRGITRAIAIALTLVAPLHAQVTNPEASIVRVVEAVRAGIEEGDIAALDTLYAHDAWVRIIEGAGMNAGWADYRDHHLAPELDAMENFRYQYFDVEARARGDLGWASFRYELSVDLSDEHIERVGRGTMILERRAGQWKVVHRHTSGRAPRPADGR